MKVMFVFGAVSIIFVVIILSGCQKVYTAEEIDNLLANKVDKEELNAMFKNFTTKQTVLNMLNLCRYAQLSSTDPENPNLNKEMTCNDLCNYYKKQMWTQDTGWWQNDVICIGGFMHVATENGITSNFECDVPWTVGVGPDYTEIRCTCCPM